MNTKKKLYMDCSIVYFFAGSTGVQRVVRNVVNKSYGDTSFRGVEIIPVVAVARHYVAVESVMKNHSIIKYIRLIKDKITVFVFKGKQQSSYQGSGPIERSYQKSILYKIKMIIGRCVYNIVAVPLFLRKKIIFDESDIFFVLDSFWVTGLPTAFEKVKESGCAIGFLLNDLIPLSSPEYVPQGSSHVFKKELDHIILSAQFCITISETVRKDFLCYLAQYFPEKNILTDSFRLGFNIDHNQKTEFVRGQIKHIFASHAGSRVYISVGTIEPRKNHAYILKEFERLWSVGTDVQLIFIGKVGWMCSHIIKQVSSHPELGKRLFMIHDVNDAELAYCYECAAAVITASFSEGFNLPLIEALSYKIPVFASDIPIHREVGGKYPVYFSLKDGILSQTILNFNLKHHSITDFGQDFTWPTWEESTRDLITKIVALSANSPAYSSAMPLFRAHSLRSE